MKPFYILFSLLFSSWLLMPFMAPPPSNDDPCNATPLTVGATCNYVQYTNDQAWQRQVCLHRVVPVIRGDVWFSVVVPASGSILIDTDDGVLTDGGMALYTGPNCSTLSLLTCDDDGGQWPDAFHHPNRTDTWQHRIYQVLGEHGTTITAPFPFV